MPATIVLAGVVVKFALSKVSGRPLAAQDLANVSVRAVPWAFFIASIRFGTNCLVGNANLVTKVYFPEGDLSLERDSVPVRGLSDRLLRAGELF